ncbi:MAG TPA: triose-phosphate isomerase [Bryobacteraceae bacterium]|jgi:triosephosphate isomerase|nr:triose-phosphate isomerase [Bryobacteraceae bacterium]
MRRRIVAGNWKMYKTAQQTAAFFEQFNPLVDNVSRCEVVIFPVAIAIPAAVQAAEETSVRIGGQNIFWAKEGAYTGEMSGDMLRAAGAKWVLVGHSERRQYFHESDADVLKKAQAALEAGLTPVICVGEKLDEHKAGKTNEVLVRQFAAGVAGLTEEQFDKIVVAYEPVWAIGTGQTATPQIASHAHALIRAEAEKRFGGEASNSLRILYGGSVKPDNIEGLMAEAEIDGALVGGASLDPNSFIKIVKAA